MGQPNELSFLPDDYLERKSQRRTNAICGVLFLAVMGGIGGAFTLSEKATKEIDAKFAQTEEQYLAEAKRIEQVRQMQEKQKRMARQAEITASLLEKVPRSYVLAEITNCMPAGASLLDFQMDSRARAVAAPVATAKTAYEQKKAARAAVAAPPAPAAPEPKSYDVNIKLTGVALTDVQVAQFLNKLSRSRYFRDVNLVISDEYTQNEEKLRKFQIDFMIDPTAEVQLGENPAGETQTTAVELK